MREKWLATFGPDWEVNLLQEKGGVRLFQTKEHDSTNDGYGRAPMYHVWNGDRWIICTANYSAAQRCFDKEQQGLSFFEGQSEEYSEYA